MDVDEESSLSDVVDLFQIHVVKDRTPVQLSVTIPASQDRGINNIEQFRLGTFDTTGTLFAPKGKVLRVLVWRTILLAFFEA